MANYQELFDKYCVVPNIQNVGAEVDEILKESLEKNLTKQTYCKLIENVDLTSLKSTDNEATITELVRKVNEYDDKFEVLPKPAGLCVYPCFVETVKNVLTEDVSIVSVAGGFPSSQTFQEIKVAEVSLASMAGADEVDVVLPVGQFLSGDYEGVSDELKELRDCLRGDVKMKVILETSLLPTAEHIARASVLAISAGADFIKTSTGKDGSKASLEAAYVMCQVIKNYRDRGGIKCGFKAAGEISTPEVAAKYLTIVENVLGEEHTTAEYFRIGASSLVNNLLTAISDREIVYF